MKTEFLDGLTRLLASVSANTINKPLPEYSSWDTVVPLTKRDVDNDTSLESPYVITTELGELITVFDLQGVFQIVGADHYANMLDELSKLLRPLCQKYGHEFWFSYEEDPDRAYDELARIVAPQILASKKWGSMLATSSGNEFQKCQQMPLRAKLACTEDRTSGTDQGDGQRRAK